VHSLDTLGWSPFFDQQLTDDERTRWQPARVISGSREHYRLAADRTEWQCRLPGRIRHSAPSHADLPVAGDWVLARATGDGTALLHRRLERRSALVRGMAGRAAAAQVVAANVDTALVVTSCDADFNPRRLERYLALAWESGANPVIVLTKADACADPHTWRDEAADVSSGVPVLVLSALRGDGLADLQSLLRTSGTSVLIGSSGVGKSTLLNALLGAERQRVLSIRESDGRGRHSTTARELFVLPGGGILIDTPGMRELQLWDAQVGLERAFADIEALAASCRYRDCSHTSEPGCAVLASTAAGVLSPERLESHRRLKREDEFIRSRDDKRAQAEQSRKAKLISKSVRLYEKLRRR